MYVDSAPKIQLIFKAADLRYCFTLLLLSVMVKCLQAQDLDAHRWKDRVLLLMTNDLQNPEYLRQVSHLQKDPRALEERRLVVYTVLKDRYAHGLPPGAWSKRVSQNPHGLKKTGFYVELIGLDGGTKLKKQASIPATELWSLIDGMPMRRAELKNKGRP